MNDLKYCPKCGEKSLEWDGEKKWSCRCGFVLYNNCAAAVAVVLRHGDEIMLTRRNQDPARGKLDLAGGFVDPHESAEEACLRELNEELKISLKAENLRYLMTLPNVYHYKGIDYNTLDIFYEYHIEERFTPDLAISEISEVVWLRPEHLNPDDIAFNSQKVFFKKYIEKVSE